MRQVFPPTLPKNALATSRPGYQPLCYVGAEIIATASAVIKLVRLVVISRDNLLPI